MATLLGVKLEAFAAAIKIQLIFVVGPRKGMSKSLSDPSL